MATRPEPPDPRLVRPITWRWAEDGSHVLAFYPSHRRWVKKRPWTGAVLEGLEKGEDYAAMVDRVQRRMPTFSASLARRVVREHLFNLHRLGHVRMDFPAPPPVFHDRYRTRKELGRGGVGIAYLCRDERTGRDVVVKHAWDYFTPLSHADLLVRAEVATMGSFDHPGIVPLVDSFERDALMHLVRGYVPGRDLTMTGRIDPPTLQKVARAIAEIVQHVHERGYLLLDHRPANFVRASPKALPVLVDVGVCVRHREGTADLGKRVGSPGFTAPEVEERGSATVRADVWGFGRLLFFLSTGTLPRKGWGARDLSDRLQGHPLERVVAACCETDPGRRPADLGEVAALLPA